MAKNQIIQQNDKVTIHLLGVSSSLDGQIAGVDLHGLGLKATRRTVNQTYSDLSEDIFIPWTSVSYVVINEAAKTELDLW